MPRFKTGSLPSSVPLLSFFFIATTCLSYSFFWWTPEHVDANSLIALKAPFSFSCGMSLLIISLLIKRGKTLPFNLVPPILLCAGGILAFFQSANYLGHFLALAGAVAFGVGTAWSLACGYYALATRTSRQAVMRTAFLAAPVAKLFTVIGVSIYLLGFTVAAVFACFLLLRKNKQPGLQATTLNVDTPKRFHLGNAALFAAQAFFIVAAVLAAAYSPNGMWFSETSNPATAGALLSCLLVPIAYWIMQKAFKSKKTTDIAKIYILLVSIALMALFIIAPQLSSFEGGLLCGLAQLSAAIAFDTIILLLMEGGKQPLWISIALVSVYSFVVFAVIICVFNGYSLDIFSVVAGIAYFLLLATVVLASIKEPSESKTADADSASALQGQSDALRGACDRLSQRFGLTQRENEVLYLLASGRSRSFIEEELVISSGTAKTHIGNIYKKMDIHSKQDLISLARKEAQ